MRRADRLFRLVQTLRDGRLRTAVTLAEAMEVSERTIYRDIADLQASGVPIDGAAGVGYLMRSGYDLPPLMFTQDEIVSLVLGARLVVGWGGTDMAGAARDALSKIEAALPDGDALHDALERFRAPATGLATHDRGRLDAIDRATRDRRIIAIRYRAPDRAPTDRRVHPLGLWFWGTSWTLVAWCELRDGFRMFRVDRMLSLEATDEHFAFEPERCLQAFIARVEEAEGCRLPPDPFDRS